MFHILEKRVQEAFQNHINVRYGIDLPIAIEQPKQAEFGELALPAAFQLAKQLRQAPKKIAAELVEGGRTKAPPQRAAFAVQPPKLFSWDCSIAPGGRQVVEE